jgi:hypothetical protein
VDAQSTQLVSGPRALLWGERRPEESHFKSAPQPPPRAAGRTGEEGGVPVRLA